MTSTPRAHSDWHVGPAAPCVICGQPAIMRSPADKPCHKVCAEAWQAAHQTEDARAALGAGATDTKSKAADA